MGLESQRNSNYLKSIVQSRKNLLNHSVFRNTKKLFFGKTIASYLRGEIGDLKNINPYLISLVYAMDRAQMRDKMYSWLNNGKTILLDRYVTSNMAHQCGRLPKKERSKYLKWLDELEYKINNVPREDIVIYLYIPYILSMKLMVGRDQVSRSYTKGKKDIVEGDVKYLQQAEKTYQYLAKKFPHWIKIECIDKMGKLRSREDIHGEIISILAKHNIF